VSDAKYGELIPLGGGDPIPLLKKNLMVGRRESCDVVLRLPTFPHIIASLPSMAAIGTCAI